MNRDWVDRVIGFGVAAAAGFMLSTIVFVFGALW